MFRPRVIPVLLLKGQGLVKTQRFEKPRYIGDPINAVRIFNDLEVDELILLDITANSENRTVPMDIVKQIGDEAFMPFGVGGGISTTRQAMDLITAGAEKVVINSAFVSKPGLVREIASIAGSQSVVVSIDVKKSWRGKYEAYSHSGGKKIKMPLPDLICMAEQEGAGELFLNSISHDGTMGGYDLDLIKMVTGLVHIPVVACGGAESPADFRSAIDRGAHAVAAGSMFVYHGPRRAVLINYPDKKQLLDIFV